MRCAIIFVLMGLFPLLALAQENSAQSEQPSKDKAIVVFFREHHFTGSALKPSVYLDGREIGRLANGYWFSVEVEPGRHELGSSAKNEPDTVIESNAGHTNYIQMVVVTGTWRGGGRLLEVDSKGALVKIAKLTPLLRPPAKKNEKQAPIGQDGVQANVTGELIIASTPPNADIFVDGAFVGSTPATLKLTPGKHDIRISLSGYQDWTREVSVLADSETHLGVQLQ